MECYSAFKRNTVLIYATTWMNPKNNMLSQRSQTEKTHIIQFHLRNDQNRQIQRQKWWAVVARSWGRKKWGNRDGLLTVEFLSEVIKIFWNKRIVTIAQSWDYAKNQWIAQCKMANFMIYELCPNNKY